MQTKQFAKQIELAVLYDVDWIGDREVIMDVFILDLIFCNMVHHQGGRKPVLIKMTLFGLYLILIHF
jgi:hypothetical protein